VSSPAFAKEAAFVHDEAHLSSEYIPVWMNKPVPALDDRKPIELISGGEYLRVARIVSALEEPVAT
jgi:uncharacterized protein (DUF2384 family)